MTTPRRIAIYARVSSEDQAERGTIQTQLVELDRRLAQETDIDSTERYLDDGVSGMIPMEDRPEGSRLLRDATAGRVTELWAYKIDRLGRREQDLFRLADLLERQDIAIMTVIEGAPRGITFGLHVLMSAHYRREFLRTTSAGIARAARAGRYTGGVVAYGYRSEGERETARIVPDDTIVWEDHSAADIVRRIYRRLGTEAWSCRQVAAELNALGVPTHQGRTGRGRRSVRTRGLWRAGRVRNMVINPVYKGDLLFGRRIDQRRAWTEKRGHEIINAKGTPLVAPELWQAAQEALARNRVCAKNTRRAYLLKGVMRCALCGLTYVGSFSQGSSWYRCGGQLVDRGPNPGRCLGQSIRADAIEPIVWAEVERFLRDPGDVLDELDGRAEREAQAAIAEADAITLRRALDGLDAQRERVIGLNIRDRLSDAEFDAELDRISGERTELEGRLAALEAPQPAAVPEVAYQLLDEVRARLDAGLTDEQRQEIVRLLVAIRVDTEVPADGGKKAVRALVEYRFPAVVETRTRTGSSRPPAGTAPGRSWPAPPERSPRVPPPSAGEGPPARHDQTPGAHPETAHPDH